MKKRLIACVLAVLLSLGLAVPAGAFDMGKAGEENVVSVGLSQTGVIDENNTLWMWGASAAWGKDGLANSEYTADPVRVLENVSAVSCGAWGTATIKTDGSLWTWGWMGSGIAGEANLDSPRFDALDNPTPKKLMDGVAAVSCGYWHAAAIKDDGSLWVWGADVRGCLGIGFDLSDDEADKLSTDELIDAFVRFTPVKAMEDAAAVACGMNATAVIKKDGSLWVTGVYPGVKGVEETSVFVKVMDDVASVSLSRYGSSAAAVKTDGSLWIWGNNVPVPDGVRYSEGQTDVPVKIADDVASVSAGSTGKFLAYMKTDGTLWRWGGERFEPKGSIDFPVQDMKDAAAVSCGNDYIAAVKQDGSVWRWGTTDYIHLRDFCPSPVQVPGLTARVKKAPAQTETPAVSTSFTDVAPDAYYAKPVAWAVDKGITSGTSATAFSPDQDCTNAQILTFLWRASGKPEPTVENPFTNSIPDAYRTAAVWAYEKGMISGAIFEADKPCTRAMAVKYIWQAGGSPAASGGSFTDIPTGADYTQAVAWAVEAGVTSGVSETRFAPGDVCSRGQIVTFLCRAFVNG